MDIRKTFGQTVRMLRKQRGYSQEAFAAKCKMHRTHMGLIETGKTNITLENVQKIAKELDVPLQELFKYVDKH